MTIINPTSIFNKTSKNKINGGLQMQQLIYFIVGNYYLVLVNTDVGVICHNFIKIHFSILY